MNEKTIKQDKTDKARIALDLIARLMRQWLDGYINESQLHTEIESVVEDYLKEGKQ